MSEFKITEVGHDSIEQIAELCTRAFELENDSTLFSRMMHNDLRGDTAITLAGWDGDTLTSSVRIFDRQVRWRGGEVRCGGIGNVACHPDHKGRGYAVKLMHHAVEVMSERGFEITILFTGIPKYYEKMGYFTWEQSRWTVDPSQVTPVSPRGITVRDADPERDTPSFQALHVAFNAGHSGTVVRTETDWSLLRRIYPGDDTVSLTAERKGEVVGHARAMRDQFSGSMRVHELLAVDPDAATVILHEMAARCAAIAPDSRALVTLPNWPVIQQAVPLVFKGAEFVNQMGGMVRGLADGPSDEELRAAIAQGDFYFWAGDRF